MEKTIIKNIFKTIIAICSITILISCGTEKKVLYFQDISSFDSKLDSTSNHIVIQKNDLLSITVSSIDQKSASQFNMPLVADPTGNRNNVNSQQRLQTYLVNENGTIDFPILGLINVLNKTKVEIIDILKAELKKYINDPIVNIRITNFNISVLGEVQNPGRFQINDERITILEALSLSGDMTVLASRKDVLVIREKEGVKTYNKLDFTSSDILKSPYYYLHQNDVVLVSPNKARIRQATNFSRDASIFVSVAGVIISVISILTR